MAPFTPFFTEVLYHNMRKVSNGSEESIHYCNFPEVEGKVPVLFFYLCFNKFISTGVFCLNDSSLQIVSMIILEGWTHWRKCQQDDDNHWSCKEYPWASKQTSQNPIEVVLVSFTCLVTWIDSFPTFVPPSNPTRMEYFHFSSYISWIGVRLKLPVCCQPIERCLFLKNFHIIFREMVVVHPDAEFLDDIAGKLREVCYGINTIMCGYACYMQFCFPILV